MSDDDESDRISEADFERIVREWDVLRFTREWWESPEGRACAARLRQWELANGPEKLH